MRIAPLILCFILLAACRSGSSIRCEVQRDAVKAYNRMQEPYILAGEDVGAIIRAFSDHLTRLGDRRFSLALSALPPDQVAAVRYFVDEGQLKTVYPKTHAVISSAPVIPFPAARKTESDINRR